MLFRVRRQGRLEGRVCGREFEGGERGERGCCRLRVRGRGVFMREGRSRARGATKRRCEATVTAGKRRGGLGKVKVKVEFLTT